MMNNQPAWGREAPALSDRDKLDILLEEYRALYALLAFRMSAMDRRLPVAAGTLAVLLGGVGVMPQETRVIFLLGLPAGLMWLLQTTVNHARAKEDELRRIDEIERLVNQIVGMELLTFQSRHPNRSRSVGGRTGVGTVYAVWTVCLTLLAGCVYLFGSLAIKDEFVWRAYGGYVLGAVAYITVCALRLRFYRYHKPPSGAGPVIVTERAGPSRLHRTVSPDI